MNTKYRFVGSCVCRGTLDNGKPWEGWRAAFAVLKNGVPFQVKVYKVADLAAVCLSDIKDVDSVDLFFDERGRVVEIGWD